MPVLTIPMADTHLLVTVHASARDLHLDVMWVHVECPRHVFGWELPKRVYFHALLP